jgi:Leucine-rich repeat (LRR) protein
MLTLNADGLYLVDLRVVPDWVINLSLQSADITSLQGLPTSLQTLRVKGAPVRNLEVIPGRLRSLTLVTSVFDHIDYVPPHLATLDLTCIGGPCELKSAVIPNSVRTLKVAGVKLERVPPSVVELTVAKARVTVSFPDGLEALSTDVPISSLGIVRLAPTLRRLAMALSEGAALPPLPASLLELDISGSKGRVSLPELPTSLRVLNVSGVKFEGELRVPKSIEVLIFNHCDANEVHNLPSRLKKLDLAGCRNVQLSGPLPATLEELNLRETDVKELGPLPSGLRRLDISNSGLYERLPQLPTRLEELILNRGQFVSLKGLPKSVRRLIFVPSRPQPDGDG